MRTDKAQARLHIRAVSPDFQRIYECICLFAGISQAQYFSARREELELKFVCQPCVMRIPPRDNDGVEVG